MGKPLSVNGLWNFYSMSRRLPAFSTTRPTNRPGLSFLPGFLNLAVDALFCDSRRSGLPSRGVAGGFSIAAAGV